MRGIGFHVLLGLVVFCLLILAGPSSAQAQDRGFDITQYHMPVDNYGLISLDSSRIYEPFRLGAGAAFHFVNDPLVVQELGPSGQRETRDLVGPRFEMGLNFAVAFCDYYEAGFALPFVLGQDGTSLGPGTNMSAAAMGDIRFHNKMRFLDRDDWPVGLGLIGTLIIPTGDNSSYAGHPNVGAEFKVVLDGKIGPVLLATNLGYRVREEVTVFSIVAPGGTTFRQQLDDELLIGVGAQVDLPLDGLTVMTELTGSTLAESPFDQRFNNPWRMLIGARYMLPMGFNIMGAAEIGLVPGYGAGPAGFVVSLGWSWDKLDKDKDTLGDEDDQCPEVPEDLDGFEDEDGCPDLDNDHDKIPDIDDQCPDVAEDIDDFYDEDGCPDPDNDQDGVEDGVDECPLAAEDKDGVLDADGCPDLDSDRDGLEDMSDKCPFEAEDEDGFQDEDGCPDPDNDADGFLDDADACPNEAEDKDGFEDEDGCPDPDNDRDGVPDGTDLCPTQKEVINGNADDDGCPDEGEPVAEDMGTHLKLNKQPAFKDGLAFLQRDSMVLLDHLALIIRAHGTTDAIVLRVHTDNRLGLKMGQQLAQARGKLIADYLARRGVARKQITIDAVGPLEPVESNMTSRGRAANNRIEIKFKAPEVDEPPLLVPPTR